MKLIQQLAPEEGEITDYSSTYSGLIYDLSFTLGLNRDPTKFSGSLKDKHMLNKYRKTWFSIIQSDSIQGFMTVRPFPNNFERQDTKLPEFEGEENNNNFDLEIEKVTISILKSGYNFDEIYKPLCDEILNYHQNPSLISILNYIELIENFSNKNFGNMYDDVLVLIDFKNSTHCENIKKAHNLKLYCQCQFLLVFLNLHLFFHFEAFGKMELAYKRYRNLVELTTKLTYTLCLLLTGFKSYAGSGFDVIMTPSLLIMLVKLIWICIPLCLRPSHVLSHKNYAEYAF
ncbi:hypothetical protein B5S31_g3643 [[Candida] boidinii]|nr:hypothetical protein B5S29_g5781 [[Candida] boidinii]OWB73876.1 hypothetical protein B5S31_g3643 [[Candida] boidinii]OWB79800.1 hypothetical protein B5S32_g4037 [[Candida] boidinii]